MTVRGVPPICDLPHVIDETEEIAAFQSQAIRLVSAWRRSGMPLGKLTIRAADTYALGAAVSLSGICDAALVDMCERYVAEHCQVDVNAVRGPSRIAPQTKVDAVTIVPSRRSEKL